MVNWNSYEAIRRNKNNSPIQKNSNNVSENTRNQFVKNSKTGLKIILPIAAALLVVIFLKGIYNKGYENGINMAVRNANHDARKEFTPQIDKLKSELDSIVKTNENRLSILKINHNDNVNTINSDNHHRVEQMIITFDANMVQINKEHQIAVTSMENAHYINREKTRRESFNSGQKNMNQRIEEVFDLNVQTNKPQAADWNAAVSYQ